MKNASIITRSLLVLAASVVSMSLTACNTVEGAGKDAERAGEKIQDVAEDAKN